MAGINIATAARKLKAQGKTLKPLETKLVNGKFVAYYTVDGKRMTAQEVKGLLKMSLARARQLSMKKKRALSLAGELDPSQIVKGTGKKQYTSEDLQSARAAGKEIKRMVLKVLADLKAISKKYKGKDSTHSPFMQALPHISNAADRLRALSLAEPNDSLDEAIKGLRVAAKAVQKARAAIPDNADVRKVASLLNNCYAYLAAAKQGLSFGLSLASAPPATLTRSYGRAVAAQRAAEQVYIDLKDCMKALPTGGAGSTIPETMKLAQKLERECADLVQDIKNWED